MDRVTRLFDCHSHWGTRRGYIFRTEAELAQQEKVWKTKATFWSEDEMADYFRRNNVRTILDLSFTKFLPIEEIREASRLCVRVPARASRRGVRPLAAVRSAPCARSDPRVRPGSRGQCRLCRTVRQRPGAWDSRERSALGPALSSLDRGGPPDHDPDRAHG